MLLGFFFCLFKLVFKVLIGCLIFLFGVGKLKGGFNLVIICLNSVKFLFESLFWLIVLFFEVVLELSSFSIKFVVLRLFLVVLFVMLCSMIFWRVRCFVFLFFEILIFLESIMCICFWMFLGFVFCFFGLLFWLGLNCVVFGGWL